jgi:hypothetical protein
MPWLAHALKKFCVVTVPLLVFPCRIARYCSKVQLLPDRIALADPVDGPGGPSLASVLIRSC